MKTRIYKMNLMPSPEKVKKVLHQETNYKQVKENYRNSKFSDHSWLTHTHIINI